MFDIFYLDKKPNLFPHEQKANSIEHARTLSRTRFFWIINYLCDYSGFDFLWEPVPWEADQIHVWPSQHQENSGTFLVPKTSTTDVNRNHSTVVRTKSAPRIGIDHGNGLTVPCDMQTRYINDYLGTLRRVLSKVDHEYVWVVSSVCDYDGFDFSWHPSEWQQQMLHVFASNDQKFGDTFYVHVPSFLEKSKNIELLEWFDTINFVKDISVPRHSVPVIFHNNDTHVEAVKQAEWSGPLVLFTVDTVPITLPTVGLWRQETKNIVPLSAGASAVIVPRTAKTEIKTQLYDYPFIDKTQRKRHGDQPLDIVFISNGERIAFDHWILLCNHTGYRPNRVVRVAGVNGRVAAYHAAAEASQTPWFFAVFAKLEVDARFDWSWQPDRMQQPKHYIFHAANPVNGLVYGHQAMIAYNKKLVLANSGQGLDFTLDSAHEVVPVLSGVARYADTPWMAWRTAFREVLKLKSNLPDVESEYRLGKWLENGFGSNGNWSVLGAQDAVEYYDSVAGDFEQLRNSYDWAWLASYALIRRNLTPDL
jgi:hypothetical protein